MARCSSCQRRRRPCPSGELVLEGPDPRRGTLAPVALSFPHSSVGIRRLACPPCSSSWPLGVSRIAHTVRGRFAMLRTKALRERETLDERDILEITGPRPRRRWRTGRFRTRDLRPGQEGSKDFAKRAQVA